MSAHLLGQHAGAAVRAIAVALSVVVGATVLASCSGTGAAGESAVASTPTVTVTPRQTLAPQALDALVAHGKRSFVKAARKFRACDKNVAYDSYVRSPCLHQANELTASIDTFLGSLHAVVLPPGEQDALVSDLAKMSKSGAKVAVKCKKANDQVCDQALARFRADEQSILWDLDASL